MGLSVGAYNATLTINEFKGIMQFDENESMNTDMRYAADGKNFDTRDGSLLPIPALKARAISSENVFRLAGYAVRCGTMYTGKYNSRLLRTDSIYVVGEVRTDYYPEMSSVYLAFIAGDFQSKARTNVYVDPGETPTPASFFHSQYWSFATYEDEYENETVQVLLLSNAEKGMFRWFINSSGERVFERIETPYNFGTIARYGERIWGAGIPGHPDLICYSAPYDPGNWAANVDSPADGGGEIRQPDFDGDQFVALKTFGSSLLAFKEHHLWRITGFSPEDYTFQEQFGTGTIYPNTIVTDLDRVYFLTSKGFCVYDGLTVSPFQQNALRTLWKDANIRKDISLSNIGETVPSIYTPVGIMNGRQYIVSFPGYNSSDNSQLLIYDFSSGSWSYSDAFSIAAFIPNGDDVDAVYVANAPVWNLDEQQWETKPCSFFCRWFGSAEEIPSGLTHDLVAIGAPDTFYGFDWLTPWTDMGVKDVDKNEFKLRFWIQTHVNTASASPITAAGKLKLSVTVETERGSKTRTILYDTDVDEEVKMRFHLTGRRVRMRIQATDGDGNASMNAWCKIMGGVQLNADTSQD